MLLTAMDPNSVIKLFVVITLRETLRREMQSISQVQVGKNGRIGKISILVSRLLSLTSAEVHIVSLKRGGG